MSELKKKKKKKKALVLLVYLLMGISVEIYERGDEGGKMELHPRSHQMSASGHLQCVTRTVLDLGDGLN